MFLSDADVRALWLHKNVSEQCACGGAAGALIPQFVDGPTSSFRREQLGLGWGAYPSILEVQRTVLADNVGRRDEELERANKIIQSLIKDARKQGLRTSARPIVPARGCTGCSSCVPEVRLRPAAPRALKNLRTAWVPQEPNGRGRNWLSLSMELSASLDKPEAPPDHAVAQLALRRETIELEQQHRLGRDRERQAILRNGAATPRRRADGHPVMKQRRAQFKAMRAAARRALES